MFQKDMEGEKAADTVLKGNDYSLREETSPMCCVLPQQRL